MTEQQEDKDITTPDTDIIEDMVDPQKGLLYMIVRFFKGLVHSDKKIGEMNGRWAALFRVVLVLLFFAIPAGGTWTMWVTRNIWNVERHVETTAEFESRIDFLEKSSMILERVDKRVEGIDADLKSRPNPTQVQEQIEENSEAVRGIQEDVLNLDRKNTSEHNDISADMKESLGKIERENSTDHAKMTTTLQFIKEQVSKK